MNTRNNIDEDGKIIDVSDQTINSDRFEPIFRGMMPVRSIETSIPGVMGASC